MNLLTWFTRNWADTDEGNDPALAPVELPMPPADALAHVERAVRSLPRWQVEHVNRAQWTLHATRHTRLWCFIDDVTIRLQATSTGTRVHARSKSRVGRGDLGQNRRNLLELFRALRGS